MAAPFSLARFHDVVRVYAETRRLNGTPVSADAEAFAKEAASEIWKLFETAPVVDRVQTDEDAVRSKDIPERLETYRKSHKNMFKPDDAEDLGEVTGPEYAKRMKAEAPAAFVRHDALDVRPEDLRLKHVEKTLPTGETLKIPLLQVLADDIREKCALPGTPEVDKLVKSYLVNHARSRADYQKQLEKSKPFREVKNWRECHKRPDRGDAQARLEIIEEALKKGGRKMKKQVHKFPVHELEDLANWLRKILSDPAVSDPSQHVQVLLPASVVVGATLGKDPSSPDSGKKRKSLN